ncbi:MAG: hypothetical protein RBR81_03890 [Bacteroidales bacterium]|nr:hypothetical protein [Bacteroidales bacterium]
MNIEAIDHSAMAIVITGISIVFMAMLVIYLFFKYLLPFILGFSARRKAVRLGQADHNEKIDAIPGDVNAAIALAIYLYLNEIHDKESNIITIKRISRAYSPWSSKLYSMRNL